MLQIVPRERRDPVCRSAPPHPAGPHVCFLLPTASPRGDVERHRQVSLLPDLHQPVRVLPGPEEVEVQPVLSGQRR